MTDSRSGEAGAFPPWLTLCASVAIAAHLLALAALVIAAPSGPWPMPFGAGVAMEPPFAQAVSNVTTRNYLIPLRMSHNYHFTSNRPAAPGVFFEVRLKDDNGDTVKVLRFPDETANFWVRHRQNLLAQALADDQPVESPGGEVIAAPHQQMQTVTIWDMGSDRMLQLRTVPQHLVPRDHPVFRPSEWSLLLARSYGRYLCRAHGAATAELVRHSREPVLPTVLTTEEPPAGTFDELVSNFGEFPR
jgi:hypothetical protein